MNHPLTDEICDQITDELSIFSIEDCMRAAYDKGAADRLEQCIAWLENLHPKYTLAKHSTLANMMKEAMRPQENNQ